jgi:hypothetical protein
MQNDEAPMANDEERTLSSFVIRTSSLVSCIPEPPGRRDPPPRRSVLDSTAKRPPTRPTQ